MTPPELAEMLRVPAATLSKWRHEGTGPTYIRIGKHVRYAEAEVERWLSERSANPTGLRAAR
ncbi:MAG: helix-turn-helix domain-containing protein [Actinobacteria bacterium]|nr:helix-turn-helix domain-containing protein [Actinomycetota bacterium]